MATNDPKQTFHAKLFLMHPDRWQSLISSPCSFSLFLRHANMARRVLRQKAAQ